MEGGDWGPSLDDLSSMTIQSMSSMTQLTNGGDQEDQEDSSAEDHDDDENEYDEEMMAATKLSLLEPEESKEESFMDVIQGNINSLYEAKLDVLLREMKNSGESLDKIQECQIELYKDWVKTLYDRSRVMSESVNLLEKEVEEKKVILNKKCCEAADFAKNHMTIIQEYEKQVQELFHQKDLANRQQLEMRSKMGELEYHLKKCQEKEEIWRIENENLLSLICRVRDSGVWDTRDLKFGSRTFNHLFGSYPSLPNSDVISVFSKDRAEKSQENEKLIEQLELKIVEIDKRRAEHELMNETKNETIEQLTGEIQLLKTKITELCTENSSAKKSLEENSLQKSEIFLKGKNSLQLDDNKNSILVVVPPLFPSPSPLSIREDGEGLSLLANYQQQSHQQQVEGGLEILKQQVTNYQAKYEEFQNLLNNKGQNIETLERQIKLLHEKVNSLENEKFVQKLCFVSPDADKIEKIKEITFGTTKLVDDNSDDDDGVKLHHKKCKTAQVPVNVNVCKMPHNHHVNKPTSPEIDELYCRENKNFNNEVSAKQSNHHQLHHEGQGESSTILQQQSQQQQRNCKCKYSGQNQQQNQQQQQYEHHGGDGERSGSASPKGVYDGERARHPGENRRFFYARPPWNDNFHKGKMLDPNKRKKEYRLVPVNPFQRPHPDLFTEDFYKRREREKVRRDYAPPAPPKNDPKAPRVEAAQKKLLEVERKLTEEKLKSEKKEIDRRLGQVIRTQNVEDIGGYFGGGSDVRNENPHSRVRHKKEFIRIQKSESNRGSQGQAGGESQSRRGHGADGIGPPPGRHHGQSSWEEKNETLDLLMNAALRASKKMSKENQLDGHGNDEFTVYACHSRSHRTHRSGHNNNNNNNKRNHQPNQYGDSMIDQNNNNNNKNTTNSSLLSKNLETSFDSTRAECPEVPYPCPCTFANPAGENKSENPAVYDNILKMLPSDSQSDCVKNWFSKSAKASRKNSGFQSTLHTIIEQQDGSDQNQMRNGHGGSDRTTRNIPSNNNIQINNQPFNPNLNSNNNRMRSRIDSNETPDVLFGELSLVEGVVEGIEDSIGGPPSLQDCLEEMSKEINQLKSFQRQSRDSRADEAASFFQTMKVQEKNLRDKNDEIRMQKVVGEKLEVKAKINKDDTITISRKDWEIHQKLLRKCYNFLTEYENKNKPQLSMDSKVTNNARQLAPEEAAAGDGSLVVQKSEVDESFDEGIEPDQTTEDQDGFSLKKKYPGGFSLWDFAAKNPFEDFVQDRKTLKDLKMIDEILGKKDQGDSSGGPGEDLRGKKLELLKVRKCAPEPNLLDNFPELNQLQLESMNSEAINFLSEELVCSLENSIVDLEVLKDRLVKIIKERKDEALKNVVVNTVEVVVAEDHEEKLRPRLVKRRGQIQKTVGLRLPGTTPVVEVVVPVTVEHFDQGGAGDRIPQDERDGLIERLESELLSYKSSKRKYKMICFKLMATLGAIRKQIQTTEETVTNDIGFKIPTTMMRECEGPLTQLKKVVVEEVGDLRTVKDVKDGPPGLQADAVEDQGGQFEDDEDDYEYDEKNMGMYYLKQMEKALDDLNTKLNLPNI